MVLYKLQPRREHSAMPITAVCLIFLLNIPGGSQIPDGADSPKPGACEKVVCKPHPKNIDCRFHMERSAKIDTKLGSYKDCCPVFFCGRAVVYRTDIGLSLKATTQGPHAHHDEEVEENEGDHEETGTVSTAFPEIEQPSTYLPSLGRNMGDDDLGNQESQQEPERAVSSIKQESTTTSVSQSSSTEILTGTVTTVLPEIEQPSTPVPSLGRRIGDDDLGNPEIQQEQDSVNKQEPSTTTEMSQSSSTWIPTGKKPLSSLEVESGDNDTNGVVPQAGTPLIQVSLLHTATSFHSLGRSLGAGDDQVVNTNTTETQTEAKSLEPTLTTSLANETATPPPPPLPTAEEKIEAAMTTVDSQLQRDMGDHVKMSTRNHHSNMHKKKKCKCSEQEESSESAENSKKRASMKTMGRALNDEDEDSVAITTTREPHSPITTGAPSEPLEVEPPTTSLSTATTELSVKIVTTTTEEAVPKTESSSTRTHSTIIIPATIKSTNKAVTVVRTTKHPAVLAPPPIPQPRPQITLTTWNRGGQKARILNIENGTQPVRQYPVLPLSALIMEMDKFNKKMRQITTTTTTKKPTTIEPLNPFLLELVKNGIATPVQIMARPINSMSLGNLRKCTYIARKSSGEKVCIMVKS